jgi:hypothetical protein
MNVMRAMDWLLTNPEPPAPVEENEDVCSLKDYLLFYYE